jgi:hypothetical protein
VLTLAPCPVTIALYPIRIDKPKPVSTFMTKSDGRFFPQNDAKAILNIFHLTPYSISYDGVSIPGSLVLVEVRLDEVIFAFLRLIVEFNSRKVWPFAVAFAIKPLWRANICMKKKLIIYFISSSYYTSTIIDHKCQVVWWKREARQPMLQMVWRA